MRVLTPHETLTPHEILDVEPDATLAEVRRAYRKMALAVHPDRNPGDAFAGARFREVRTAYEALVRDVERRDEVPLAPIRIACVLVGGHLVGSLRVGLARVRRNRWIPVTLWATRPCSTCEGVGSLVVGAKFVFGEERAECPRCDGIGLVGVERNLRIRLPTLRPGVAIRLRGEGIAAFDGTRGDAFLHLG
jgi:DnaJ-class molecular chaperone